MTAPVLIIKSNEKFLRYMCSGQQLTLGRSNECDVVLNNPTVSRKHAVIKWESKYPVITDCQSTPGLFFDNEKISFRHIIKKHEIRLGLVTLTLEIGTETDILQIENIRLSTASDKEVVTLFGDPNTESFGYLSSKESIQRYLAHMESCKTTGTLFIFCNGSNAEIVFGAGKIRAISFNKLSGEEALRCIFALPAASYQFSNRILPQETTLNISVRKFGVV